MRSCRVLVLFAVAVVAGLAGVGSASAGVARSAGHAVVRADGGDGAGLQDPYEDTRELVDIYRLHRMPDEAS